jgi:NIPSNAP
LAQFYDVTVAAVRPGTHPQALAVLDNGLRGDASLLGCWYSDIGAVNQILIIRNVINVVSGADARAAVLTSPDPWGLNDYLVGMTMDTYESFDFIAPMRRGDFGPCYEVRSYGLKPGGLAPTKELWRKAVPGRMTVSPLLAAMTAVTGAANRFMHIWPYKSFDERARLRDKAVADKVWPPPGGPSHLVSQQVDIYLPAAFSPMT